MVEMFRKLLAQEAVVGAATWTSYTLGPDDYVLYGNGLDVYYSLTDIRNLKLTTEVSFNSLASYVRDPIINRSHHRREDEHGALVDLNNIKDNIMNFTQALTLLKDNKKVTSEKGGGYYFIRDSKIWWHDDISGKENPVPVRLSDTFAHYVEKMSFWDLKTNSFRVEGLVGVFMMDTQYNALPLEARKAIAHDMKVFIPVS